MKNTLGIGLICSAFGIQVSFAQNVGINPGGSTPNSSAILDLNTGNTYTNPNGKGLLIPNVALTATTAQAPVSSPATSLLVYNTATASSGSTAVYPGYYYWDGTKWVALGGGNGGLDWSLTGNAGTTAGTNFIGTTDAIDWVIKTNNTERMRVLSGGNVGIGTSAAAVLFHVMGGHTTTQARLTLPAASNGGGTGDVNLQLWASEPGITWDAGGIGTNVTNNGGTPAGFGRINTSLGQSYIRFVTNGGAMAFNTTDNSGNYYQTAYMIGGNVGIGTTSPGAKLSFQDLNNGANTADGITWYNPAPTAYGIFRTSGAWSAPNYQQLQLGWQTGVIIDGGSAYGLSGTLLQPTAGNVGVGQAVKPAYNLEVNGTFGFGEGTAGSYRSRTEYKNDAGQIASQSGFFQTAAPTNYPAGASGWWHLIDCRHSNNGNNFAMQISGSFWDQDIYYRKTVNNAAQPWSQFLTTNNVKAYTCLASQTSINSTSYLPVTGLSLTITTSTQAAFIINTTGSLESWAGTGGWTGTITGIFNNGSLITEQGNDLICNNVEYATVGHWGINYTTVLPAGTYTFLVKCRYYNGTNYFYAGGASTTGLANDGSMTILVVPQ